MCPNGGVLEVIQNQLGPNWLEKTFVPKDLLTLNRNSMNVQIHCKLMRSSIKYVNIRVLAYAGRLNLL